MLQIWWRILRSPGNCWAKALLITLHKRAFGNVNNMQKRWPIGNWNVISKSSDFFNHRVHWGLHREAQRNYDRKWDLECGNRIDLLVENKVVIEIKSVEALNDVHLAQTLTYMKLGNYKLGLLINFNVLKLKDGIKRVVNGSLWISVPYLCDLCG